MPISRVTGNVQKSTPSSSSGGGERATFRPPWVKTDPKEGLTKVNKPTSTAAAESSSSPASTTKKPTPSWMKNAPVKKEPAPQKEVKLQSREIKVPVMTEKPKPVQPVLKKPVPKKEPTPPPSSSSEEEETEEEETEDDEDSEDDEINELIQKMKEEKEKVRPVAVRKDKSQSAFDEDGTPKKFKFDKPVLKKVTKTFDPPPRKEDDKPQITAVLRKTPKYEEKDTKKDEEKPEFKNKVLKKVEPIKRANSIKNGEFFELFTLREMRLYNDALVMQ